MIRSFSLLLLKVIVCGMISGWNSPDSWADRYALVICGSGGEEEYRQKFREWGNRLQDVLLRTCNFSEDNVLLLIANQGEHQDDTRIPSLENIRRTMEEFSPIISNRDDLYLFFIGHGSYFNEEAKFHIPGPDVTATDFQAMIEDVQAKRMIVINMASSSAGFINILSGQDRIICTATKSVDEMQATEFAEFFIRSLEEGSADRNHDDRISVFEACEQAAQMTEQWYEGQGLLATEHAILDDNGDGLGTRLIIPQELEEQEIEAERKNSQDGELASRCFLKEYSFLPTVPESLTETYLRLMDRIEELKSRKDSMNREQYYQELETLLIEAAKVNREMKQYEQKN